MMSVTLGIAWFSCNLVVEPPESSNLYWDHPLDISGTLSGVSNAYISELYLTDSGFPVSNSDNALTYPALRFQNLGM